MPGTQEYDQARQAVKAGQATPQQIELVGREAKQAGSRGSAAREALKGK